MGINNFNSWLHKKYGGCFSKILIPIKIDYLYIDLNYIFHRSIFGVNNLDIFKEKFMSEINLILSKIIPQVQIVLATDSEPPFAKIILQRERRFKMIKNIDDFDKLLSNNNFIHPIFFTPGTNFMLSIGETFKDFFDTIKKKYNIEIIKLFDDPGEAEIKIINQININSSVNPFLEHIFYSSDGDSILIVMANSFNRCNIAFTNKHEIEHFNVKLFYESIKSKIKNNHMNKTKLKRYGLNLKNLKN